MDSILLFGRVLLAVVFATAALGKLAHPVAAQAGIREFGLPQALARVAAYGLPLAELAIAAALIPPQSVVLGSVGALVLLLAFVVAIIVNLSKGRRPPCHCFGQIHSSPAGWRTVARNGVLIGLAGVVAWGARHRPPKSATEWTTDIGFGGVLAIVAIMIVVAALAWQGWMILQLLRQHGRLLLRIEALEAGRQAGDAGSARHSAAGPAGLPVGSEAPEFSLPGLHGETLTLAALRSPGKPVMLIFTSTGCGPCEDLLPDIARWQQAYDGVVEIALISSGAAASVRDTARQHRLRNVLLQDGYEVAESFEYAGTPGAVVVSADGLIASPVAAGAGAIRSLLDRLVADAAPVPLVPRDGRRGTSEPSHTVRPIAAPTGRSIPSFSLRGLDGNTVDNSLFRGGTTLVLFWNPGCGFCQKMLPDLKAWETAAGDTAPRLLVMSVGSVEENRRMGLQSTVAIDVEASVARSLGAHGTPMAVLVDSEGRVASELVAGAQAVLGLATGHDDGRRKDKAGVRGGGAR